MASAKVVKDLKNAAGVLVLSGVAEAVLDHADMNALKAGLTCGVSSFAVHEVVPMVMDDNELVDSLLTGLLFASVEKWGFKKESHFVKRVLIGAISDYIAVWGVPKIEAMWSSTPAAAAVKRGIEDGEI